MCPPSSSLTKTQKNLHPKQKAKKSPLALLFPGTDFLETYIVEAFTLSRTSTRYFSLPALLWETFGPFPPEPARELLERIFRKKHFSN